ncbi:MAG: thiamine phosphate synthase [Gemmatimonadota bacterium]
MTQALDRSRPVLCFVHEARTADPPERLWLIGDEAWSRVDLVQVRGKALPAVELEGLARGWVARLAALRPRVIVNDRLDIALAAGAHGVHLGRDDLPLAVARELAPRGFLIGASTHGRQELLAAQEAGADYAGLGAFFDTSTKPGASRLEPLATGVAEPVPGLEIAVLAIGGITAENLPRALETGVTTGVAVSSAIQGAPDPEAAIVELHESIMRSWEGAREGVSP